MLYPAGIGLLWTLYILSITSKQQTKKKTHSNNKSRNQKSKCIECKCKFLKQLSSKNAYLLLFLTTMWNKNIMYYEQSLSQILGQGSYYILFTIFMRSFNFIFITNSSGSKMVFHWWIECEWNIIWSFDSNDDLNVYHCPYIISEAFFKGTIAIHVIGRQFVFIKAFILFILVVMVVFYRSYLDY